MIARKQIQIRGIVQSVGFRPFVYSLARRHGLNGIVQNNEQGVLVDLEGHADLIDQFLVELRAQPPSLAQIDAIELRDELTLAHYADFHIVETAAEGARLIPISPDVATCADCVRELFDPHNRRFRYPFINCTNCGPRFTIIEDVPYDREKTTMREFEMCADCRAEYENPIDRRFHAEPTACAECGPQLYLTRNGNRDVLISGDEALRETTALLRGGKIVAVKGIGGFHLACDALNERAVTSLRQRKYREDKPFALMARTIEIVSQHCEMSEGEQALLISIQRPIVLLQKKADSPIPTVVAPRLKTLGFMLPYSPLHYLLLGEFDQPLVMTSANISDEPICYEDTDASRRLAKIADYYLMHNRRIHMRTDDSVMRIAVREETQASDSMILRRSRGYAPEPIRTAFNFEKQILACGAELKNTFCLTRHNYAFISHHIGDLENVETLKSFTEGIEHFKRIFYLAPDVVVYDLHPEYLSTKYALERDDIETKIGVQHHHAHIASCMADNQIDGEVIGVAMDGLGFGADRRLWGGEFLVANFVEAQRFAHLDNVPMPGGAKAIREPWRMAAVYLRETFGEDFLDLDVPFVKQLDASRWKTLRQMIESGANSPETSSMGRLFDAVAALLCLRSNVNYEGQAAVELEQIAEHACDRGYEFDLLADNQTISAQPVINGIVNDLLDGIPRETISMKFHLAVSDVIVRMAVVIRDAEKLSRVVMSGGVFQNVTLLRAATARLQRSGFEVFTHRRVPTNDGGISLGQAAVANARLRREN